MTDPNAKAIRRSDIFWLGPDDRASVRHPHVVIQDDVFHRSRINTVIVRALTSNLNRASEPGNVLLDPLEGGLSKQSVVVVSQIVSAQRGDFHEYIGSLSEMRVQQIIMGLTLQQSAFFKDE